MPRTLLATAIVTSALGLGLSAQSTTGTATGTTPQSPSTTQDSSRDSQKEMTLTGCVQKGETTGKYVLTNVKHGSGSGSMAPGATSGTSGSTSGTTGTTSGTTGSGTMAGMAGMTQVQLKPADSSVKFDEHIGHRVEITGKMDKDGNWGSGSMAGTSGTSGSGTAGTSGTGSPATGTPGAGSTTGSATGSRTTSRANPTFEVKSVRMVSATCS